MVEEKAKDGLRSKIQRFREPKTGFFGGREKPGKKSEGTPRKNQNLPKASNRSLMIQEFKK